MSAERRRCRGLRSVTAAAAFLAFLTAVPALAGPAPAEGPPGTRERAGTAAAVVEIISERTGDRAAAERLQGKLSRLSGPQERVVAELVGRISAEKRSARAEIAFSLLTALLVLS